MPAIVKVKVFAARDLPVMDRSSDSTDCFVEIRLGQSIYRTEVCKKTLNPVWDTQWFTYNVDDEELQDEPLTFKVMDYDQYSAHDAIGRVYISLDTVVVNELTSHPSLDGWFPIYDTLHGIRGEVHIKVMVEMIRDEHRHKHSSNEIMLFSGVVIPDGFSLEAIQGFVEELVVNDDPEYQWIDRIRPPRASNESRQQVFLKLSGELQRKIGMKALESGGNAIIGYSQSFDLEGESGIVVRGIGTSVTLKPTSVQTVTKSTSFQLQGDNSSTFKTMERSLEEDTLTGSLGCSSPALTSGGQERPEVPKLQIPRLRQLSSSESDGGPSSPGKPGGDLGGGQLLGTSSGSGGGVVKTTSTSEFHFYTLTSFPPGFIKSIAGIVAARSVKLLDDINNPDEPETRDAWWKEVRQEIKSHSHSMCCNAVIGYTEDTSICDGLCIFSATGTAVVISANVGATSSEATLDSPELQGTSRTLDSSLFQSTSAEQQPLLSPSGEIGLGGPDEPAIPTEDFTFCGPCHAIAKNPSAVNLVPCAVCRVKPVPAILLSTADIPPDLLVRGEGCLVQARVCRNKKRLKNEDNASHVSSMLPFVEYSLHGRLLNKLKLKGMNALFGLNIQITVGDTMIVGVATGTGVYLEALPTPGKMVYLMQENSPNRMSDGNFDVQMNLDRLQEENRQRYNLYKPKTTIDERTDDAFEGWSSPSKPSTPKWDLDESDIYSSENVVPIEVNEQRLKSEDIHDLARELPLPKEYHVSNLSSVPGLTEKIESDQLKVISFVSKQIFDSRTSLDHQLSTFMNKALQSLLFRVRKSSPCVITNISFEVDLPDDDEVQVTVVAVTTRLSSETAAGTANPLLLRKHQTHQLPDEFMFAMDGGKGLEEPLEYQGDMESHASYRNSIVTSNSKEGSLVQKFVVSPRPQIHCCLSSKYLSTINLFLIRETTSIRELGGMSSFLHTFISEAHALARAHVLSRGGNALVNYQLRQCIVMEHQHKNQGQCLLNLTGDAAQIHREVELWD